MIGYDWIYPSGPRDASQWSQMIRFLFGNPSWWWLLLAGGGGYIQHDQLFRFHRNYDHPMVWGYHKFLLKNLQMGNILQQRWRTFLVIENIKTFGRVREYMRKSKIRYMEKRWANKIHGKQSRNMNKKDLKVIDVFVWLVMVVEREGEWPVQFGDGCPSIDQKESTRNLKSFSPAKRCPYGFFYFVTWNHGVSLCVDQQGKQRPSPVSHNEELPGHKRRKWPT